MPRFRSKSSLDEGKGWQTRPNYKFIGGENLPFYDEPMYPTTYQTMIDQNNGRSRINSPCSNGKVVCRPKYIKAHGYVGKPEDHPMGCLDLPPPALLEYIRLQAKPVVDGHHGRLLDFIQNKRKKFSGDFSSLNLLYELREVGGLLKDIDGKFRSLSSYRPIDYIFGVAPLVADLRAALQQYNSLAQQSRDRAKGNSLPISRRLLGESINFGDTTFFGQNTFFARHELNIVSRAKGTLSIGVPVLASISPEVFAIFDSAAIDVSAANAWNAIPFTWLFDYFLPIGNALSSLPTLMKGDAYYYGTISHRIKGVTTVKSSYSGPSYYFPEGEDGGQFITTSYTRHALNESISGNVKFDVLGGINSIPKMLVLRDILDQKRAPKGIERVAKKLNNK